MSVDRLLDALRGPRGRVLRAWRLRGGEWRRLSLGVKDGHVGGPHAPLTLGESADVDYLLVWEDGRVSRGTLERRQLDDPHAALDAAHAAAYDDPDAAWVVEPAPLPDVRLHDTTVAAVADGDTAPLAARLDAARAAVARAGAATWSASFSAAAGRSRIVTSTGLDASAAGTSTGWFVSLDGEIGDGHQARAFESADEFAARLDRLVDVRARLRSADDDPPSGEQPVLLHPRVVDDLVLDTLLHGIDGSVVADGEGVFPRAAFGADTAALREDLELTIDPLLPLRSGSYRCTREGVPARRTTFVSRGRLVTPLLGTKYARRLDLPPTAVAAASDTIEFGLGAVLELDDALARAGAGALVLRVLGVHTQDRTSGDFSLSAPQALAIRAGALGGRVRGTIAGSVFGLLRAADTAPVRFPGETVPGLLVRCRFDPRA